MTLFFFFSVADSGWSQGTAPFTTALGSLYGDYCHTQHYSVIPAPLYISYDLPSFRVEIMLFRQFF